MNTPVNPELSKLLKEKGFDEPCYGYFVHGEYYYWIKNSGIGYDHCRNQYFNNNEVAAPFLAEVVMWLYEKHGIWIEILLEENRPWDKFYYRIMKVGQYFTLSHNGIYKKSPTEAYAAAIEHILNKLI